MLYSKIFSKTSKTTASDADSVNARLLTQAGFIQKQMAGVYIFLPLGLRVLNKIENIIREEMEKLGACEVLMPTLTQEDSWQKTKRADLDILFHLKGRGEAKLVLNPTHEEVITPLMKNFVASYRDLPFSAFQFQNKFRNEPRAKSGLLRGREFLMKDLYSFHADEKNLDIFYEKAKKTYVNVYKRLGIGKQTFLTYASGGSFSKFSHEFQTICEAGEDTIYLCDKCKVAINQEIIDIQKTCPICNGSDLRQEKAAEAGNIFKLRTKFSEPFNLTYKTAEGKDNFVEMGCYGIGLSRAMGIIVELFHDDKGIIWPENVAPFQIHLMALGKEKNVAEEAQKIYQQMQKKGIEVLYDDRADVSAGEKFAVADLIGLPYRVVISEKTLAKKSVELKKRTQTKADLIPTQKIIKTLSSYEP